MIAYLTGTLAEKSPARAVIDVGGVGFEMAISLNTYGELPAPGERVTVRTVAQLRDEAIQLFGFAAQGEIELFRLLLTVPGIGPKLALGILSGCRVEAFRRAVLAGDAAALARIPGIGKKSAGRLIVELKGRFEKEEGAAGDGLVAAGEGVVVEEALLALETLGVRSDQAQRAVERVLASKDGAAALTVEEIVREVLSSV